MACLLAFFPGSLLSVAAPRPEDFWVVFFSLNFHNQDMSKQHFAGGPLLYSLGGSLHLSPFQKRGTGKSRRLGWRRRTPLRWGRGREEERREGQSGGSSHPRIPPPSDGSPGGCGRPRAASELRSPGAGGKGSARYRRPPGSGRRRSTAAQQSARLLLQLPAVEGLS